MAKDDIDDPIGAAVAAGVVPAGPAADNDLSEIADPIGDAIGTTPAPAVATSRAPAAPAAADTTDYANMPWSDVASTAVGNIIPSAKQAGSEIVHAVTNPTETLGALENVGKGLYSKAQGALGVQQKPDEKANTEALVDAIGQHYSNAYGSESGLKQQIATDPFGTAMDAATVLTGGETALGKVPGIIGKTAQVAGSVGSAIDPIQNTIRLGKLAAKPVTATAGAVIPYFQSAATGAPTTAFKLAATAGATADPTLKAAFVNGMRNGAGSDIVDGVNDAIGQIAKDRSDAYVTQAKAMGLKGAPVGTLPALDWTPVNDAMSEIRGQIYHTDQNGLSVVDLPNALPAYKQMADEIAQRQGALPGSTLHTLEGFDGLKKNIGDIIASSGNNAQQRRIATTVKDAVTDSITATHPDYAALMQNYSAASDQLNNLKAALQGNRATQASTSKQLAKILRTYGGNRDGDLLSQIAAKDPTIPYMLAGKAVSEVLPSRFRTAIDSPIAALALFHQPALLPALAGASPRMMGELNYAAGKAGSLPSKITPGIGEAAYQTGQAVNLAQPAAAPVVPRPIPAQGQQPRNARNNNGGNIVDGPFAQSQPGYAGSDGTFARFATPSAGDQAGDTLLRSYGQRGYDTPQAIVHRWTPPDSNPPQAVAASVGRVSQALGVNPLDRIDLMNPAVRKLVYNAIVRGEAATGGRITRASGGRTMGIDHAAEAAKLVRQAEKTKKQLSKATEPLLGVHDTAIAKALETANHAI